MEKLQEIAVLTKRGIKAVRRLLPGAYYVLSCLCVFTVLLVLFSVFFRPCTVEGSSMVSTLQSGDRLLLNCWDREVEYGDIIAIRREKAMPLIKRVIAKEGDTLYIDALSGGVYRNGELLNEPYVTETTPCKDLKGEVTIPKGCLFVMGDNRSDSHDSRYEDIGMVSAADVIGTAVLRFYPLSEMGGV